MHQAGAVRNAGNTSDREELTEMRLDAQAVIARTIEDVLPMKAVRKVLEKIKLDKPVYVFAIGKAAWEMADEAVRFLGNRIVEGIVVTKYGHSRGKIPGVRIMESGHPMPDENSVAAAGEVLKLADRVTGEEQVLLLLSGGGSALVEMPAPGLTLEEVKRATDLLLKCGANIVEMNTVRKHLSSIKGGKLAERLLPAKGYAIILSDVVGNHPEMIASGMTYVDDTDAADVMDVIERYGLDLGENVLRVLGKSSATLASNIVNIVEGSVEELCHAAARHTAAAGYTPYILSTGAKGEAKELGKRFARMAWDCLEANPMNLQFPCALIVGGETVVRVTGNGMGGRNQEIALQAAKDLKGRKKVVLFSLASDGTDGPTDAAGGIVDGTTAQKMEALGMDVDEYLQDNDAYHALEKVDCLLMTGPTGTNVNDVTVMLIREQPHKETVAAIPEAKRIVHDPDV